MNADRPYFTAHEAIYAAKLAQGDRAWDAAPSLGLQPAMDHWLATSSALRIGARVLELGCGTGEMSGRLEGLGASVTGVDVSASAIHRAQAVAAERGVKATFVHAEAAEYLERGATFDVIVDAHMLHCLVTRADRDRVLRAVATALSTDGEFWTESMLWTPRLRLPDSQRADEHGVVWKRAAGRERYTGEREHAGDRWVPTRYLAPSADALLAEYARFGLHAIEFDVVAPGSEGAAPDFRARLAVR